MAPKRSLKRPLIILATILVVLVIGWRITRKATETTVFKTAQVQKGDLTVSITATGTVEPEEVIDVGAQVAGLIFEFGKDDAGKPIDYGSQVDAGTVLAKIDDTLYASDVLQAQAQLKNAVANQQQAKAKLAQAERDWKRAQKLGPSEALSQASVDGYQATYESAQAGISIAEAQIAQANATLAKAQRNIAFCTIASPVKGVIIDRRVNIGQTVVSSLNAPSLFLLAKDLKRMQVWVAVNEADIGHINPGQKVTFTADAFPGETFAGQVVKVRLNATMTQNVVTYTVEVATDNSSGRLLPYLTANAKFEVSRATNVLTVPNAALRWSPTPPQISPEAQGDARNFSKKKGRTEGGDEKKATPEVEGNAERGTVWVLDGEFVKPVRVQVLGSDGIVTQIAGEDVSDGMNVVIGVEQKSKEANSAGTTNPFAPQVMKGRGGARGGR